MPFTLGELATLLQGRLCGDPAIEITGAATLACAAAGEITLADHADRAPRLASSPAAAAIVNSTIDCPTKPTIVVDDVHAAFAQVIAQFRPRRKTRRIGISPHAFISPTAQIGADVDIHAGAAIGDHVVIGAGSTIHAGACIMAGSVLGENVTMFPNSVAYEDTRISDRSIIHAGAVLGCYGFGYREHEGRHELSAQLGSVEIGADVEIGACATIDRGTYGPTTVGDGTKIDNLVQIAHNCQIGKHNLICGQVGIAGSTSTGDRVVMAGQVGVRDHVHIGAGAVLCSKAGVSNHVDDGEVMLGQPATPLRRQKLQMAAIAKLPEMRREFRQLQQQLAQLQTLVAEKNQPSGEQAA